VRFVATMLMWLVTTVLLVAAVPAAWVQQHLVDEDGYAALAQKAATTSPLQDAMAGELGGQLKTIVAGSGYDVGTGELVGAASIYTRSSAFPNQFAQANRLAHRWLFSNAVQGTDASGRWQLDLTPMLADSSFRATLSNYGIEVPSTLAVPLTDNVPQGLRPGKLRPLATWGPWVSVGLAVLAGVCALLTLFVARSRGKTLAALGVSGLLVGAAGWAGIEFGRRYVNDALINTTGDIRRIADAMVSTAEASMHQWLNVTLIVGGGLVLIGVIVSLLASLAKTT
jgi:hypothetical protein